MSVSLERGEKERREEFFESRAESRVNAAVINVAFSAGESEC